ncbi:microtubule-associated protein 10-like [Anneissia japonica]|uniref:microtubule-associated protein 10-like n=1 Tax=Anneissia japonica TaxID=1529436 RepID=UPI0014255EDF|nr:microtubule-associated protein 10-like [Anneissia japonica]
MAKLQTLFSLELDIDFVHVQPSGVICRIPAVAFRLMDFPTLLIHHVSPANIERIKDSIFTSHGVSPPTQLKELKDHRGNFVFKKGKSCLFKSDIDNLLGHLKNTPLYVMILDMWPSVPKLVGNCSVSLQSTIEDIVDDVERTGISVPTVHGSKYNYKIYNLMGSEIGYVSLGFKLLSLGAGLISHIPESSISKPLSSRNIKDIDAIDNSAYKSLSQAKYSGDVVLEDLKEFPDAELPKEIFSLKKENNQVPKDVRSSSTQTGHKLVKSKQKIPDKCVLAQVSADQDIKEEDDELGLFVSNTVCPPPLFFNSKCDDRSNQSDHFLSKKVFERLIPEPEDSEDSFSDTCVETRYVFPPDSQHSVGKVCKKPHHKLSDSVDGKTSNTEHRSVAVQSSPDVRTITSGLINQNLPILAALLRELSVLQSNRTANLQPHQQKINTPQAAVTHRENNLVETEDKPDNPRAITTLKHVDELKKKLPNYQSAKSSKKKMKLKFGMTHSQKLRLQRNNPDHLKVLEREESKQKRDKQGMNLTYKTPRKAADILTEIQRHPSTLREPLVLDVSKGKRQFDTSSPETEGNTENNEFKDPSRQRLTHTSARQRPIPAPRQSKETPPSRTEEMEAVQEREEIQGYMSVGNKHKNIDQKLSQNEEEGTHHNSKDGSETSSRHIEVHIPSVSNYTNESDSDRTGNFSDQSEEADISVSHVSPKKAIDFPGFPNVSESKNYHDGEMRDKELVKKKGQIEHKGNVKMVNKKSTSLEEFDNKRRKGVEVLTDQDPVIQSSEFEHTADNEILEGAQFEDSYTPDFDIEDTDDINDIVGASNVGVLEFADYEGSYSYDFDTDDQSRGKDFRPSTMDSDQDEDSLDESLSSTTSSGISVPSQRTIPMPHSSKLQRGSLAIPKPTLSSKSPLPNKKTSGHTGSGNLFSKATRTGDSAGGQNFDMSVDTVATKSSVRSEFLTGDSDILQSMSGTARTRSSDDLEPSYSDLLTDGSREF